MAAKQDTHTAFVCMDLVSSVALKICIENADFGEIVKVQSYKKIHSCNRDEREKVFDLLNTDYHIKQIIKTQKNVKYQKGCKDALKAFAYIHIFKIKTNLDDRGGKTDAQI